MSLLGISLSITAALAIGGLKSGKLSGHLDVGPLSPVERPGVPQKVPLEVYKRYRIAVMQPGPRNGQMASHLLKLVANLKLDKDGNYSVELAPGLYRVGVESANAELPMRQPTWKEVTIKNGKTIHLDFKVDTGIR